MSGAQRGDRCQNSMRHSIAYPGVPSPARDWNHAEGGLKIRLGHQSPWARGEEKAYGIIDRGIVEREGVSGDKVIDAGACGCREVLNHAPPVAFLWDDAKARAAQVGQWSLLEGAVNPPRQHLLVQLRLNHFWVFYRLGQLRKSWRFRTSSLPLPSVVAVDHPLIRKKRSPIPRTGLAGSQAERNENGTERNKDGTELKRCENAVPRKRSHRRTIVRRSSNVNFLLTGTVAPPHSLHMLMSTASHITVPIQWCYGCLGVWPAVGPSWLSCISGAQWASTHCIGNLSGLPGIMFSHVAPFRPISHKYACKLLKGHGHGSESPHTSSIYRSR